MPPAAAIGGSALVGLIAGNAQNKSNQQAATNAQNAASQDQQQATQQAFQNQQQALQDALSRYAANMQQNPNPAFGMKPVTGPQNYGGGQAIGGQTISAPGGGSPGMAAGGQQNLGSLLAQLGLGQQMGTR